jgi:hypothetical protein
VLARAAGEKFGVCRGGDNDLGRGRDAGTEVSFPGVGDRERARRGYCVLCGCGDEGGDRFAGGCSA